MGEPEISSITKEEYAYVITLSDGTCWVQRACPRTGVDYPMSDYEVLLLAMIRERDRLAAENERLQARVAELEKAAGALLAKMPTGMNLNYYAHSNEVLALKAALERSDDKTY